MTTTAPEGPEFFGRTTEVEFLLEEAGHADGTPHTFVVGPAGVGRTDLLSAAARTAASRAHVVLRAGGAAAERDRQYALVHRLVAPLLASARLRDQAVAHRVGEAFAAGPGAHAAVAEAVPHLLRLAAESAPVLAVVDDAHLADPASQVLLADLAREGAGTARLLLSAPGTRIPPAYGEHWRSLCLGPLQPWEAARLLDALPGAPQGRERAEILLAAAGNPLAVTELVRSAARRRPAALHPRPSTSALMEDLLATVEALSPRTRSLLLHAALAAAGTPRSRIDAAAGTVETSWAPAREAGLVEPHGDGYDFTHPLARAVAATAPLAQRQAAHARLAAAVPAGDPQRPRHLARASFGPDEALAARLEAQAERERAHGAFLDAARDFATAAERSAVAGRRVRRYAMATFCADRFGDPGWARQLQDRALREGAPGAYDVCASLALADRQSSKGHQRQAMNTVAAALETVRPGSSPHALLTARAARVADESGWDAHRAVVRTAVLKASRTASPGAGPGLRTDGPTPLTWEGHTLPYGLAALVSGSRGPADTPLDALPAADGEMPAERLAAEAVLACHLDRQDLAVERFELVLRGTDPFQAGGLLREVCLPYAAALVDTGRLRPAAHLARRGHELALVHGSALDRVRTAALYARVLIQTRRGTEAKALLEQLPDLDFTENRAAQCLVGRARAMLSCSLGDFEDAYHHLRGLFGPDGEPLHPVQGLYCAVPLALCAQRAGRGEEAAVCVKTLPAVSGPVPTPRQAALLDHAEALTRDPGGAEERFLRALKVQEDGLWPYDLGLVRYSYGAWLRRRRRSREAREVLLAARRTFARLGPSAVDALVLGELRAAGGGRAEGPQRLTPQQRQVAELAADGLRNPEIARRLMISPHTVRCHLYRAFHKLGINDRRHLPGVLPPQDPTP
ncbi:transcriptional regulator [Streptomyces sulfonofaciens]|uniref:Transcriptional regulator n=1 Tax=Streptomyces sulfonofaciens TaxID=68272 RepID=A0A919GPF5_9ACTN|nr:LuxR family transcriptional regulator [Streptomyces sulfonofaciens]GHH88358.1 transcriptional regulator [Streptomyces sulfonofaciens]